MIYEALLLIGGVGLAAQGLLGFAHAGDLSGGHQFEGGDLHGHAHVHLHFGGGDGGPPDGGADGDGDAHGHASAGARTLGALWTLLSPLTIFSLCLGAGATGLLARPRIGSGALVAVLAAVGAVAMYALVVRPLWRLVMSFASKPAQTLAGAVAREAEAAGRFDAAGRGIVTLNVDGQIVRLLARLEAEDLAAARTIAPGDRLVVTGVDARRGACTVTKL